MNLDKDKLINELILSQLPEPFTITRDKETDLIVQFHNTNEIVLGDIRISELEDYYYGYLLLDTNLNKAYYHEELVEKGKGIDPYTTNRGAFAGIFQYKTYSLGGLEADEEINYPLVRDILENKLKMHGWKFELAITKNEATYKRFTTPKIILFLKKYLIWSVATLLPLIVVGIIIYQLQNQSYRAKFFDMIILALVFYIIRLIIKKLPRIF